MDGLALSEICLVPNRFPETYRLESTDVPVERVAHATGFGTAANMRLHFQRAVGTAPTSYRRAFQTT